MMGSMSTAACHAWRSFWFVIRPSFLLKTAMSQKYGFATSARAVALRASRSYWSSERSSAKSSSPVSTWAARVATSGTGIQRTSSRCATFAPP